ncbi:MAG: hypothetical protein HY678_03675, partial [Chloroflexi bacterium]|nr:hypothetical protein [Chloroflexota bacterium]
EPVPLAAAFNDFIGINTVWQVDPPVPATTTTPFGDQKFTADLTIHYDAIDFPDDANFKEANLKVVSFDPATGKLTSYTTTLDTAKKTAAARVEGLGPYYTLGVFGPFTQKSLDFPMLRTTSSVFTGLGFLNLGTEKSSLTLTSYGEAGTKHSGSGVTNPTSATLSAAEQIPKVVHQFFNFDTNAISGWVQVRADKKSVVGFELIGDANTLDGVDVPAVLSPSIILTDIEYDPTYTTEIHIANPTNFQTNVTLELRTNAPSPVEALEVSLAPKAKLSRRIQDLFPLISKGFFGYLLVRADHDISAAELLVSRESIAALNGQILQSGISTPAKLYSAQLANGGGAYYTRLNLVNPTSKSATITIRAIGETGASLSTPVTISLGAGEQYQRDVGKVFGLNANVLTVGSLVIDSSITGIVGGVTFGDPSSANAFRSSLPLDAEPAKFAAFAQVANGSGYFTGFAVFNPNSVAANIDLKIYASAGVQTGSAKIIVAANGRTSKLLPQVVSSSEGQVGGYFTLSSDQPVSSFAVFGTTGLTALSAVPPQRP